MLNVVHSINELPRVTKSTSSIYGKNTTIPTERHTSEGHFKIFTLRNKLPIPFLVSDPAN